MLIDVISPLLTLHQLLSEGTDTQETARKKPGEKGDGAERSLILPLQPPDEHPPDYHLWGPLSST